MDFIRRLRGNIRYAFADLGHLHIRTERDRMFIAIQEKDGHRTTFY
ncbi:putative tRNA sulfurtransferase OS=Lysinibacillus sphaericus OX=1421 GN=thiI PE=3 SV=1 [Lysinibacillus sphaericus]